MTTVKPTSIKALCLGCNKEFTKKTLDEHDGICGRCFNKKTENSVTNNSVTNNSVTSTLITPVVANTPNISSMSTLQIMPASTNTSQYSMPVMELKMSNLSIEQSRLNASLTLSTRLDNWYRVTRNNDVKNNAAVDLIYTMLQSKAKDCEKIPNVNLLNFEKMLSTIHKALAE